MQEMKFYCMRFYVTYKCNSRCYYCNVWQEEKFRNVKELEYDEGRKLIRQCYEIGIRYIDFTGGEPTLCKNLEPLICYAKSLGIKTEVTVNCVSGATKELLKVARCAHKFNVSLDTLNSQTYRLVRGVDRLEKVKRALDELSKIRDPRIMMVVSEKNISDVDDMIRYAQQKKMELYLNPIFTYSNLSDIQSEDYTALIASKVFEPYTVIMLHFMEFLKQRNKECRPLCSANLRTLTFAPDGSLILPCYHAVQEMIPWNGNLNEVLASRKFRDYAEGKSRSRFCRGCAVIPYFGISMNYCLDTYFLIQSYSEKLNHLKHDYLNHIHELKPNSKRLSVQLRKLFQMTRSLKTDQGRSISWLYWAEETEEGYRTEVYRRLLTKKTYEAERKADDCWHLKLVPHHFFDQINEDVFNWAFTIYQSGEYDRDILDIFLDAEEFQLRWWKLFIGEWLNISVCYNPKPDKDWIISYLSKSYMRKNECADLEIPVIQTQKKFFV